MADYTRDIRDSARDAARSNAETARAAQSAARGSAEIARSAQSTANGVWASAGIQAVTAFQTARAAKAQEQQLEIQRAMAEQEKLHQFAMWRQTPDGIAFVQWRDRALRLVQLIRNRDTAWLQVWAQVIMRAHSEIPEAEIRRISEHAKRVNQMWLTIFASILSAVMAILTLRFLVPLWMSLPDIISLIFNPEENISLYGGESAGEIVTIGLLLAAIVICGTAIAAVLGLGPWRVIKRRRKAALEDLTVSEEREARIQRWGFDPLAVQPGFQPFTWHIEGHVASFADQIVSLILQGPTMFPSPQQLPRLDIPQSWPPAREHPEEINDLLVQFQNAHAS